MATDFTTYTKNAILNHIYRNTALAAPAVVYASLWNGDPESGGTEVTTTIRVAGRVAITFGAPSAGVILNSAIVNFGNAAAGATVTYMGISDASSGGNLLNKATLGTNTVLTGVPVSFAISSMTVTVA